MQQLKLVGISFHRAGKIFDFDAKEFALVPGDQVIVETERGKALGTVVNSPRDTEPENAPPKLKAVLRMATENDRLMSDSNAHREQEAIAFCQQRIAERRMEMKLVKAEYLYDGSKIIFFFTADGRIDFRELVRDLAQHFRTRIEMRQIGVRDEAKMVGGIGICGRELCCCNHLREFAPVSVKMAKAQGLALNPTKISGQCGRLLCCLAYEYETYNELVKTLPKCGKKLQLPSGTAEVISLDILSQKVTLCRHNGDRCTLKLAELEDEMQGKTPPDQVEKKEEQVQPEKAREDRRGRASERPKRKGSPQQKGQAKNPQKNKPKPGPEQQAQPGQEDQEKKKTPRRRRRPRRRTNRNKSTDKES